MIPRNKELCLDLMRAEAEDEIIRILRWAGYWDDSAAWRLFGDMENNFSTIGNQSDAVPALVEKIINSIDARLIGECRARGIDPEGSNAPQSSAEAVALFFEGRSSFRPERDGKIAEWTDSQMREQARQITLTLAGGSRDASITIADTGEGQIPDNFPDTFLSLNKSNKLRIPFVQGKFNMGGTGALQFCGDQHNFQLIVSRRRPELLGSNTVSRDDEWGFTIIRRRAPEEGVRSSVYEYLAPNKRVLSFPSETMPLFPRERTNPQAYATDASFGTLVKLYSYSLSRRARMIELVRHIEIMLPRSILPVRIVETRRATHGGASVFGLTARLQRESERVLESGFPRTGAIALAGQHLPVTVYVFLPGKIDEYRPQNRYSLNFLVNGQTHASRDTNFYRRQRVRKSYLAPDLLTIVDCTNLPTAIREDLFFNSRDRMRGGSWQTEIEGEVERFLREDEGLIRLNQQRREALLSRDPRANDAAVEVVRDLLSRDTSLRRLLLEGGTLGPIRPPTNGNGEADFQGRMFPTFFTLVQPRSRDDEAELEVAKGSRIRFEFQTDAADDYFERDSQPGHFAVTDVDGRILTNDFGYRGPSSGRFHLWANDLSGSCDVGDSLRLSIVVDDENPDARPPFETRVNVHIKAKPSKPGPSPPPSPPSAMKLPNLTLVWREQGDGQMGWADMVAQGIPFDDATVVEVRQGAEATSPEAYDVYLNMDNVHVDRARRSRQADVAVIDSWWKDVCFLLALALLADAGKEPDDGEERRRDKFPDNPEEMVRRMTRALAPIILPMRRVAITETGEEQGSAQ